MTVHGPRQSKGKGQCVLRTSLRPDRLIIIETDQGDTTDSKENKTVLLLNNEV